MAKDSLCGHSTQAGDQAWNLYYFGVFLITIIVSRAPQDPILIIKAPIRSHGKPPGCMVSAARGSWQQCLNEVRNLM